MDTIYTLKEMAELLKINEYTLYRLVEKKELPYFKIGNSIRFRDIAMQRYIEREEKKSCL